MDSTIWYWNLYLHLRYLLCFRLECGELFDTVTKLPADDNSVEFFYKTVWHSRGLESDVQVVCFFCRETTYMHAYICSCLYLSGTLTCIHVDSVLYVYVNSFIHYRKASAWHNVVRKVKFARAWGSFQDGIFPGPGPGFEWGTVTKWWDVTFSSHLVTFQVRWDSARFHKKFV